MPATPFPARQLLTGRTETFASRSGRVFRLLSHGFQGQAGRTRSLSDRAGLMRKRLLSAADMFWRVARRDATTTEEEVMDGARSAALVASGALRQGELPSVERENLRLLSEARVILNAVALAIALLEPSASHRLFIFAILLAYAVFGVVELRRLSTTGLRGPLPFGYWVDLAAYAAVIAVTGGLGSRFVVFLLFPLFAACIQRGLKPGAAVALVSVTLLAVVAGWGAGDVAQTLLRDFPVAKVILLIVAAGIIARWAHSEVTMMRRLAFCNDVARVFTPRHDLRQAITGFAEMLVEYQRASGCVLLVKDFSSSGWVLFEVARAASAARAEEINAQLAQPLLVLPEDRAVLFRQRGRLSQAPVCREYDMNEVRLVPSGSIAAVEQLAELLEARSLVSLPLRSRGQAIGRLHLLSDRIAYGRSDVDFIAHVLGQVSVLVENMYLVDRLTREVANEERTRISRDLHDSTIQPYIGLRLALEALRRKVAQDPELLHEVSDLVKMAGDGIDQLRHYVGNLKSERNRADMMLLLPALRRQAARFSEYYGIRTEVRAEADVWVKDRLVDEIVHIAREALSNIRRHTRATRACIDVRSANGALKIQFANDTGGAEVPDFLPRSISERAKELGGRVDVGPGPGACTVVSIEIPL